MKDKNFGSRLKQLRHIKNLRQIDAASLIGISYGAIQLHEGGSLPSHKTIEKYIKFYNCNKNWLLTGDGEPYDLPLERLPRQTGVKNVPVSQRAEKIRKRAEFAGLSPDEFYPVQMAEAHLNAGGGNVVLSENMLESYIFRKEWISKVATSGANLVLMEVDGDSMQPAIENGDTVMIDQGRKQIKTGCIYAIGISDTILIKRLEILPSGINVISDNKTYAPFIMDPSTIRIIGQVIWLAKELVKKE